MFRQPLSAPGGAVGVSSFATNLILDTFFVYSPLSILAILWCQNLGLNQAEQLSSLLSVSKTKEGNYVQTRLVLRSLSVSYSIKGSCPM